MLKLMHTQTRAHEHDRKSNDCFSLRHVRIADRYFYAASCDDCFLDCWTGVDCLFFVYFYLAFFFAAFWPEEMLDRSVLKMRINVYSQELTSEVVELQKKSNTGLTYSAVQLILHSSEKLHHPPNDDDRSAVTFWLPKSAKRRDDFARSLERMAFLVRNAPPETGLD